MRRLRLSLRYKFVFTLVGFTLLVAVPLGVLLLARFSDELESQLRLRWETTAKGWLAAFEASSGDLSQLTTEQRTALCREFLSDQPELLVLHVTVAGEHLCLVHSEAATANSELQALFFFKEPPPPGLHWQKQRLARGPDLVNLRLVKPVLKIGVVVDATGVRRRQVETFSSLQLGINTVSVEAQIRRETTMIALIVLGYVLLGLLIAFIFYKMILGPVEGLAAALKLFKRDPSARARVTSGDELETLAYEFNQMADAIAERKCELERINAELSKANHAKSDFLAVMSHELKTPLHAIRGYSQLLLEGIDGPLTQAQREDLQNILNSGDHLLQLIDNILRFSKLEASEDRPYFEATDAAIIAEEAIKSVSALARAKRLILETSVASCTLWADATKLKQILLNLLSNAIKYTPTGKISVQGKIQENEYLFIVADTGPGIPPHERARVFEPFTQLDSSNTRESHGVGLGLAIVKKYTEMNQGRVWVESEVGRGSTFFVALPLEMDLGKVEEVHHAHSHH